MRMTKTVSLSFDDGGNLVKVVDAEGKELALYKQDSTELACPPQCVVCQGGYCFCIC